MVQATFYKIAGAVYSRAALKAQKAQSTSMKNIRVKRF